MRTSSVHEEYLKHSPAPSCTMSRDLYGSGQTEDGAQPVAPPPEVAPCTWEPSARSRAIAASKSSRESKSW